MRRGEKFRIRRVVLKQIRIVVERCSQCAILSRLQQQMEKTCGRLFLGTEVAADAVARVDQHGDVNGLFVACAAKPGDLFCGTPFS